MIYLYFPHLILTRHTFIVVFTMLFYSLFYVAFLAAFTSLHLARLLFVFCRDIQSKEPIQSRELPVRYKDTPSQQ